jgi:uncharacterized Zn finger protein
MAYYREFGEYVSSGEKKARAARAAKKLSKARKLQPVCPAAYAIATTWWGKSWIKNLEGYADYSSRLPRGRSYVRTGAVIDLGIENGTINALVAGSKSKPYEVSVTIAPLNARTRGQLVAKCRSAITGLPMLLSGEFPKDLEKKFLARGDGLFPAPREIQFDCTCPDWASMCKHVAAALYGAAVRLDEKPELFFILRGMRIEDFVGTVLKEETDDLLAKAKKKSSRRLSQKDSSKLFGIE